MADRQNQDNKFEFILACYGVRLQNVTIIFINTGNQNFTLISIMQFEQMQEDLDQLNNFLDQYLQNERIQLEQSGQKFNLKPCLQRSLLVSDQSKIPIEQEPEDDDDQSFKEKIRRYNLSQKAKDKNTRKSRKSKKDNNEQDQIKKRKVRTTITESKLEEMNKIFAQFSKQLEQREKSKEKIINSKMDKDKIQNNLKTIGQQLQLGYSTILHKFRQYRATKKVKGGALIASSKHKRKYQKSKTIESYIQKSLSEKPFYTAVELSKYIKQKYNKDLSRSIISRHLGQMGYSYKNVKSKVKNDHNQRNSVEIKKVRQQFINIIDTIKYKQYYYLDSFVIAQGYKNEQETEIMLIANSGGILKFQIKESPFNQEDFFVFVESFLLDFKMTHKRSCIILDMKPSHTNVSIMKSLNQKMVQKQFSFVFIPPQSQQLNFIEFLGADIKAEVQKVANPNKKVFIANLAKMIQLNFVDKDMKRYLEQSKKYFNKACRNENF